MERKLSHEEVYQEYIDYDKIINYLQDTQDSEWCMDVVRKEGEQQQNCFFGHLYNYGGGDEGYGNRVWNIFESFIATTYMIYPVNDGKHPKYQQSTPKERIIAYLEDLRDGKEKTTYDYMNEEV